ncbi:MAG: hypothetical protein ACQSGP_22895 [Frankia sp.]
MVGQAVGDVLTGLLAAAGDTQPDQHVLQLWATAHGLIALRVVGRVQVDSAALHALLDNALTDCLTRALPTPEQADAPPDRPERASAVAGKVCRASRRRAGCGFCTAVGMIELWRSG